MFPLMRHRPARPERAVARRSFDPFTAFRDEMEGLFNRFNEEWRFPVIWMEPRDWKYEESDKEVVMRLEAPGFDAKDFELRVEGNVFMVRAEHAEAKEKEKNGDTSEERYEYRFVMPYGTDVNRIEAKYHNGILELHLPRLPEAEPKRIEVKT